MDLATLSDLAGENTTLALGGMLAGGCAVGAGVTGSAVFALTAWVALSAMWLAAILTDYIVDHSSMVKKQLV